MAFVQSVYKFKSLFRNVKKIQLNASIYFMQFNLFKPALAMHLYHENEFK